MHCNVANNVLAMPKPFLGVAVNDVVDYAWCFRRYLLLKEKQYQNVLSRTIFMYMLYLVEIFTLVGGAGDGAGLGCGVGNY